MNLHFGLLAFSGMDEVFFYDFESLLATGGNGIIGRVFSALRRCRRVCVLRRNTPCADYDR
jgi:diacylglycerol kinase family enzyme